MPTPVSVARQCLTPDAVHALDEAVAVARRRGHAQTTSLHAVSALLSLSSSALRDACARARNTAYSPRLQFKALELCLSVSLDRVPSSQLTDDPPVSNSLMAAIKRSQANQRRHPENFHLYHQISQQQNQSSISCIKVELQQLILSILDDPVVSRVFGEAGFRSSEIKLAIVRPLPHLLRYPRHRGPPLFLCNLSENPDPGPNPGRRGFSFPFSGFPELFHGDENGRRIGEVLAREKGRNPLLMGVCAYDTLNGFLQSLEKKENGVLPQGISGLNINSIENEISKQIKENFDRGFMDSKFDQMRKIAEQSSGPGLVVNYGDLKMFVNGDHCNKDTIDNNEDSRNNDVNGGLSEAVSYLVGKLTKLMQIHGSKVWLIGAVASYEVYLKFVTRFSSVEKDWDLQILPITSLKPCLAESYPRSSLMESFVPFGGFFSMPSELKGPFNGSYQSAAQCNEKSQQELIAGSNNRSSVCASDQCQSSPPSWLQTSEPGTNKGLGAKTKDGLLSRAKVTGLQRKEDATYPQRLHQSSLFSESNTREVSARIPTIAGFRFVEDKKEITEKCADDDKNAAAANGIYHKNRNSFMSINLQKMASLQPGIHFSDVPKSMNQSIASEVREKPLKPEDLDSGDLKSPKSFSNSSTGDGSGTSLTSASSIVTDLGLGLGTLPQVPGTTELRKPTNQNQRETTQDFSSCFPASVELVNGSVSNYRVQSSSSSYPDICGKFDSNNFKMLFKALTERVGCQDEAAIVISRTIAHCRTRNSRSSGASLRGDVWFNFTGPDRCGKRKLAVALADVIYGSREDFIHVDLGAQEGIIPAYKFSDHRELNGYDMRFRGKTVVDFVAGELCRKPLSVVFLENVDKADALVEKSLSQAIRTGKFSDSHGREVSISNTIFVTTITSAKDEGIIFSRNAPSKYSEVMISKIKGWPVQILIEHSFGHKACSPNLNVSSATRKCNWNSSLVNKRKLIITNEISEKGERAEMAKRAYRTSTKNLDLNLPAEENESGDTNDGNSEDHLSENSKPWLHDFFKQIDQNIIFKPFDFNSLSEKISGDILKNYHKFVNPDCTLEIDSKVMDQLLASAYLSDWERVVEDWVEQVLSRAFAEVSKRYHLTAQSVVKLVACKHLFPEEQTAAGSLLPNKIILN